MCALNPPVNELWIFRPSWIDVLRSVNEDLHVCVCVCICDAMLYPINFIDDWALHQLLGLIPFKLKYLQQTGNEKKQTRKADTLNDSRDSRAQHIHFNLFIRE